MSVSVQSVNEHPQHVNTHSLLLDQDKGETVDHKQSRSTGVSKFNPYIFFLVSYLMIPAIKTEVNAQQAEPQPNTATAVEPPPGAPPKAPVILMPRVDVVGPREERNDIPGERHGH